MATNDGGWAEVLKIGKPMGVPTLRAGGDGG